MNIYERIQALIESDRFNFEIWIDNVCSENKYTKRSSNTLLRLVYLFSEWTLIMYCTDTIIEADL